MKKRKELRTKVSSMLNAKERLHSQSDLRENDNQVHSQLAVSIPGAGNSSSSLASTVPPTHSDIMSKFFDFDLERVDSEARIPQNGKGTWKFYFPTNAQMQDNFLRHEIDKDLAKMALVVSQYRKICGCTKEAFKKKSRGMTASARDNIREQLFFNREQSSLSAKTLASAKKLNKEFLAAGAFPKGALLQKLYREHGLKKKSA